MAKTPKGVVDSGISTVNRGGVIYNMNNPAHRKALKADVPPPPEKKSPKK